MCVHGSLFIGLLELFISMYGVRGRSWRFILCMTVSTETGIGELHKLCGRALVIAVLAVFEFHSIYATFEYT
jgi:hypothetical protein